MYITRVEIENVLKSSHRYLEAYNKAISLMRNNIDEYFDLDTEFKKTGETRNTLILSIVYNLTGYYMSLLGAKIDGILYFERASLLMQKIIEDNTILWGNIIGSISDQDDLQAILSTIIPDAPSDGTQYARKDGDWTEVSIFNYERRSDTIGLITYQAFALVGSAEDEAVWTITKTTTNAAGDVLSSVQTDNAKWTERTLL